MNTNRIYIGTLNVYNICNKTSSNAEGDVQPLEFKEND